MDCCNSCVFYDPIDEQDEDGDEYGMCRCHAPFVGDEEAEWPRVKGADWCGEHVPTRGKHKEKTDTYYVDAENSDLVSTQFTSTKPSPAREPHKEED